MTPAKAKRERDALLRAVRRDVRTANKKKLLELRERLRSAKKSARAGIVAARAACRARRTALPTVKALAAALKRDKAAARASCVADVARARALGTEVARKRGELSAERKEQRELLRIERLHKVARKPGLKRVARQESDDEVRGNIPPELAALFERVKRSIHGSDRVTRTEAFLEYAEEHPDEEWEALEGSIDREIDKLERRSAMANPQKKTTKRAKEKVARAKKRRLDKGRGPRAGQACAAKPSGVDTLRKVVRAIVAAAGKRRVHATARAGTTYFKAPPAARAVALMRLARGTPREKRAAVAIARLEAEHDTRPPRRPNGGALTDDAARREYVDKHWGALGTGRVRRARAADPSHGTLVEMGKVIAITYTTRKRGDRTTQHYEHEFEAPFPSLLFSDGGLVIAGGGYRVARGGITG